MSPILKSWLMLLGLLFQGKYWEPTIRSLGCYLPFDLGPGISSSFGSGGLSSCQPCGTEQFIMLRGDQCMCLDAGDIPKLDRVRDEYCDIQCPDSDILCGGNLGGNVYCNLLMENCWTFNNVSEPSVDIYHSFDDAPGGFDRLEPCLNAGCGQPDFWNRYNLTYLDYFPNMSPEACVIYCTYERTAYALVGYYSVERFRIMDNPILGTAVMMPVCACSNVTLPANPNASPCSTVPCPSSNGSCGNQDPTLPSWGRYCTTAVQTFANGTTYCAPYQPISSKNDDVDTCISLLLDTTTVEITANEIETTTEPSELTSTEKSKRTIPPTRAISITVPTVESRTEPEEADGTTTTANPASTAIPDASLPSITGCNIPCNNARVAGKEIKNYAEIEPTPTSCESGPCDFGDKTSCYFGTENKCYFNCEIRNYSMNGAERRKAAIEECSLSTNGHLLAIETIEEREFITKMYHSLLEQEGTPCLLTSGVKNVSESYWDLPTDRVSVDTSIAGDILNCPVDGSSDDLTYLMLQEPFAEPGKEYNVWRFSSVEDIGLAFICEYDAPVSSTTSSTSVVDCGSSDCSAGTASPPVESSTTNPRDDRCFCEKTDLYHDSWRIEGNKTETRRCREGAKGNATWACDYIGNTRTCQFHTEQPDFSLCHSDELEDIANSVASNDTELMTLWVSLCNFTKPDDKYFGHEIHTVLSLVTQLLNRQDWELDANETVDHLPFQIETTQIGTEVIDNLVSHDAQWNQIEQDSRSDYALYLIDVAEDLGFRLSDVAQSTNQSLRCETPLPNVTISSSYWNGYEQAQVAGCELTNSSSRVSTSTPQGDTFQRFPLTEYSGSSYIAIPSESIVPGQVHKAAGVLIAHYILDRLLPGTKTEPEGLKQVNSPLISYTIKGAGLSDLEPAITNIPEGTFVQIVFQHAATAKNPPVRTLRRDLDPGEMPSAIIGSASCAFLNYTPNAHLWTDFGKLDFDNEKSWTWNGEGCFLVSTNRSHTVCKCNHLTGFSAIMDFHNYTGQSLGLEITSVTCSSFSMISLIVTFTVLTVLRSIKTDRTIITQNLCVSLALAHLLTLLTLDRHDLHLDDVTCAAMGILLHFSLVTSFMWMGVEGLRLCRIVLYVFNVVDWTLYYLLAAYVVPFLVVGFTVLSAYLTTGITSAYAGDETCWLNGENYLWAFAGPVAAIILANIVFLAIAVYSSWNLQQNKDREMPAKIKNAAAMTLSLTCLLGITWLSGFFLYTDAIAFAYIFTITNGLQGVMILLFRCVLNDEVRTALEERYRRYKDKKRMGKWPSMLTNTTTANRDRLSYVSGGSDDGKDIQNMNSKLTNIPQLSQAISQTSVSSETTTASTDTGTPQHKAVLRTFSGTEFSECSSEDRGSICSSIMEMSIKHDDISPNATRVSRRVSFLTVRDMATTSTEVLASRRRFSDLPTND